VEINPLQEVGDGNALLDAVLAGVGVGYLPRVATKQAIDDGHLVEVLPGFDLPDYTPVYVIRGRSDYVSPGIRALMKQLDLVAKEF